jgi:hypothetical protein
MGDLIQMNGAVPAHIQQMFGGASVNEDLKTGVSQGYPIVSYKGKTWHVVTGDDRQLVTLEGSSHPAPFIKGVLIRANPNLAKVYYPNGYEEGSTEKPTCHSNDSVAPAADAAEPQAVKCAACPFNQWGSKITESGARGKACSDSRRMAIAPEGDLENAMLLRVPAASLKNLLAYAQQLEKRGVPYQALVTEIAFDPAAAFPQLTFKPSRWLDEAEVAQVQEMYESDIVRTICALDVAGYAEALPPPADDNFLPPGGPAPSVAKAQPKAGPKKTPQQAQPEEVEQALQGANTATPGAATQAARSTGFGGGGKAQPQATPPAEQNEQQSTAQTLAAGVDAEMDAVLSAFDDA